VKMLDNFWTDVESDASNEDYTYEASRRKYVPPSKKEMAYRTARVAFVDAAEGSSIVKNRLVEGDYYGASSKAIRTVGNSLWDVGSLLGMGMKEGALLAAEKWNGIDLNAGSQSENSSVLSAQKAREGQPGAVGIQASAFHVESDQERRHREEQEWIEGDPTLDPKLTPAEKKEIGRGGDKPASLGCESSDNIYRLLEADMNDLRAKQASNPALKTWLKPEKGKPDPRAAVRHAEEARRRKEAEDFKRMQRVRDLVVSAPQQRRRSSTLFVEQKTFATPPAYPEKVQAPSSQELNTQGSAVESIKLKRSHRSSKTERQYDPDGFRVPQMPTPFNTYNDAEDEFAEGTKEYGVGESILRTFPLPGRDDGEDHDGDFESEKRREHRWSEDW
jgi:hypothetical protein